MIWEENDDFEISTLCIKCFNLHLPWKSVNNNGDYTYKVKDFGFGSPGAPHGSWKGWKPKICPKMGNGRVYFDKTTKTSIVKVKALDGLESVNNN
jgi:hypothetical protein